MKHEPFELEVTWARGPAEPITWRATGGGSQVIVTLPDGTLTPVTQSTDPAEVLEHLAMTAPGINRIPAMQFVKVTCSPSVEAFLPLWLIVEEDAGPGPAPDDAEFDLISDELSGIPHSSEHSLRVNGSLWVAVEVINPKYQSPHVFVPLGGSGAEGLLAKTYGLFSFMEMGGMISGLALSAVGLITPKVLGHVRVLDEEPASLCIYAAGDTPADLRRWILADTLAQDLRSLWNLSEGDADFIEWGFLQLAKSGQSSIQLAGLTDECENPDGEGLGMGLTTTAKWTFESDLAGSLLQQAVSGVADRRPGLRGN